MLTPGAQLELTIEKPAGGGRMVARHQGLVVLVSGAVPGERVLARVERVERRLAFAAVTEVREPSPDRRAAFPEPACGGCQYSHIAYARQLELKADIIKQAFVRIGRVPVSRPVTVMPSPERGYRMRARLHVRDGRAGFFREGTHILCDPGPTGQLAATALDAIHVLLESLEAAGASLASIELTENMPGDARVVAVALQDLSRLDRRLLSETMERAALAGLIARDDRGRHLSAGSTHVADPLSCLTAGRAAEGSLARHPDAFFQANRFLVPHLVDAVLDCSPVGGSIVDLYAGVGLFAASMAALGYGDVTAVEGDLASGADLQRNAGQFGGRIRVVLESVEAALAHWRHPAATVIVDPPRTGVSSDAMTGLVRLRPERLVYVSCDPATLARDARKLLDAGYGLATLRGFDFFPNTPHVESLAVFDRSST